MPEKSSYIGSTAELMWALVLKTLLWVIAPILLTAFYIYINPDWYGDAVWYATDLKQALAGGSLPEPDSGHLLWRPLGYFTAVLIHRLSGELHDPLFILQCWSALFMALTAFTVYFISRQLELPFQAAIASALIVALSNFALSYGGSGSAYSAAQFFITLSFLLALKEYPAKDDIILSALFFVTAVLFWAPAVLLFPALVISGYMRSGGGRRARIQAVVSLVSVFVTTLGIALGSAYLLGVSPQINKSFLAWLSESSHNIPLTFSLAGVLRAALGFMQSFIYLGDTGTAFKTALFAGEKLPLAEYWQYLAALFCFVITIILSLAGHLRRLFYGDRTAKILLSVALVSLIPVTAFSILWQGSDIERFSPLLPFVAVTIVAGLSEVPLFFSLGFNRSKNFIPALAILIGCFNFVTISASYTFGERGIMRRLMAEAEKHMPANSLVVLHGQSLGPSVWAPLEYFSNIKSFSVLYDIQTVGVKGWDKRLEHEIEKTLKSGGEVAVLSDLVGIKTEGGIGLSQVEYPRPSDEELKNFFRSYIQGERWRAGRFLFVEIKRKNEDIVNN
ncbi:MAG: hypothetical protein D6719_07965 [Candidatus Dadabacteria bacterium]|nr:MAG: hypothetical protein D6719_07965 [Candidatus Dadabacteria bacterium]